MLWDTNLFILHYQPKAEIPAGLFPIGLVASDPMCQINVMHAEEACLERSPY